jgi:hypothetical protein
MANRVKQLFMSFQIPLMCHNRKVVVTVLVTVTFGRGWSTNCQPLLELHVSYTVYFLTIELMKV